MGTGDIEIWQDRFFFLKGEVFFVFERRGSGFSMRKFYKEGGRTVQAVKIY